jgi:hypothetical protein
MLGHVETWVDDSPLMHFLRIPGGDSIRATEMQQ